MKHMLSSLLSGAAASISIELLAAILLSSALHLGVRHALSRMASGMCRR